ncbi:hypothetical protein QJQ45_010545 [Haematococcus lacustris]|nr:hypothetical protein QJQ45_010545 [Haematococcus lacustris]
MHLQVLSTMQKALQAERPDLLDLLRTRLLPVLVACLEPLTVQELAWATGCEADIGKVQQLVGLLADLLPCRADGVDQQKHVAPYHTSVLHCLTLAAGMSAAQFHVGTQQGHRLLASLCLQQAVQCVVHGQADSPLACTRQGAGLGCSLRHAVAHACLSGEVEVLETLILELGSWQAVITTVAQCEDEVLVEVLRSSDLQLLGLMVLVLISLMGEDAGGGDAQAGSPTCQALCQFVLISLTPCDTVRHVINKAIIMSSSQASYAKLLMVMLAASIAVASTDPAHLQHLAAASLADTSLEANLKHIVVTLATWDAVWVVYLNPKSARKRPRLYRAQDRALEQFFKLFGMPFEERARRAGTIAAIMEKATKRLHEHVRMPERLHEPRIYI